MGGPGACTAAVFVDGGSARGVCCCDIVFAPPRIFASYYEVKMMFVLVVCLCARECITVSRLESQVHFLTKNYDVKLFLSPNIKYGKTKEIRRAPHYVCSKK